VRGGDRFALALISLALDEVEATGCCAGIANSGAIVASMCCSATIVSVGVPRKRQRQPRGRRSSAVSPIPALTPGQRFVVKALALSAPPARRKQPCSDMVGDARLPAKRAVRSRA
jgi:hypothetical protein